MANRYFAHACCGYSSSNLCSFFFSIPLVVISWLEPILGAPPTLSPAAGCQPPTLTRPPPPSLGRQYRYIQSRTPPRVMECGHMTCEKCGWQYGAGGIAYRWPGTAGQASMRIYVRGVKIYGELDMRICRSPCASRKSAMISLCFIIVRRHVSILQCGVPE